MVRNTFIPFLVITATTISAVYVWFDESLLSILLPMIAFICLVIGGLYFCFFLALQLFPIGQHTSLPALQQLPAFFITDFNKQLRTKTFITGLMLTVLFIYSGLYSWTKLTEAFKNYQLNRFGKTVKAYITDVGYEEDYGTYRAFEFTDESGTTYNSRFLNSSIAPGSPIFIKYSTHKPSINEVIWPLSAKE